MQYHISSTERRAKFSRGRLAVRREQHRKSNVTGSRNMLMEVAKRLVIRVPSPACVKVMRGGLKLSWENAVLVRSCTLTYRQAVLSTPGC
jgi:hypothetical protein